MSNYFQVLERLETDHGTEPPAQDQSLRDSSATPHSPSPERFDEVAHAPLRITSSQDAAYAGLLDNLRAQTNTAVLPRVVIAGVSERESVEDVIIGIDSQFRRHGLRLCLAELLLSNEYRGLRPRKILEPEPTAPGIAGISPEIPSLKLTNVSSEPTLQEWFSLVARDYDFLIIKAPPLLRAVDGALLAKQGDGLLLVAEPMVTPRRALQTAVDRSKASGATILGLVMNRTSQPLPRWLRVLFS